MSTLSRRLLLLLAFAPHFPASLSAQAPSAAPHGEPLVANPLRAAAEPPLVQELPPPVTAHPPASAPANHLQPIEGRPAGPVALPVGPPEAPVSSTGPLTSSDPATPNTSAEPAPSGPDEPARPRLTRLSIEERIASIQKATQPDEATRAELIKRYQAALDWMDTAEEAAQKTAQYQADIAGATELIAQIKTQLAAPPSELPAAMPADATLQDLERHLAQAETQLSEADRELTGREEELKRRGERKSELAKLTDDTRQRLDDTKKLLVSSNGNGELAELATARRTEIEARQEALKNQLERYRVEAQRHDAFEQLLPVQRDLARRERNQREKAVAALQQVVAAKRKAESERQAREARWQAANTHSALRQLAERNAELAEQHEKLAESITDTTQKVTAAERQRSDLAKDYLQIQEKVRYAGNSSSIGLMLRKRRDELPDVGKSEEQIRFVAREMPDANLMLLAMEEDRAPLGDLDTAVAAEMDGLDASLTASQKRALEPTVRELLEKKRDLLDALEGSFDDYLTELSELEVSHHRLATQIREFTAYVDEHVLWVRSADMLRPGDVMDTTEFVGSVAQPGPWIELAKTCGLDTFRQAPITALAVLAVVLLLVLQQWLRNRYRAVCGVPSGSTTLKLWPTVEGVVLAAVIAAPWPLLFIFSGWRIAGVAGALDLGQALGWGLTYVGVLLWFVKFTRRICQRQRVGENHFGWSSYSLGIARRHLRWLSMFAPPLVFLVVFACHFQEGAWNNSLGRLAFMATLLLLAVFLHSVLFAKDNVLREIVLRNPTGWLARLRGLLCLAAIGLPLSLAVLAAVGYYYSAQQLALRLEATLATVLGLVVLHALVSRWFLVKRRNLAIAQTQERREQESPPAGSTSPIVIPEDNGRDLSAIHKQLNYLLGNAVAVCLFVGGWMIWADVFPALKVLDRQELWQSTVEVVEIHEDTEGNEVRQRVPQEVRTTLRHAVIAGLILLAALVIAHHLPALLEITVLDRLPFDKGGRHAISVILRYLVGLTGLIMACRTLNITWSSVQWLAAGMTIGLGFGLQEVFANFISGLILLFERPIRVGDVITLGDVSGTVTNIRIRATTVTNWDRKELIVPNKELITGRILNWTLSDSTNRIVINVGVAYKSDTRKAREVILAVARDHANVLDDPGPRVTFESFGDSSLNFVLRCYIASMDIRLDTIDDLNETIHDRFNAEGIEIAFPQRDLHVRSVEQAMSLAAPAIPSQERAA